jgi:hypothetical protein
MMDALWMHIVELVLAAKAGLDTLVQPLNAIHPALTVMVLAGVTVLATSEFRKRYKTKRFQRLEEEFHSWFAVRQQALESFETPEKGRQMARNIDQATLNKVYYDYFFEGLLNNLLTTYLPVLCMAAYVNEAFRPENLQQMIGQGSLLSLAGQNGAGISALAWFVLCLTFIWIGKAVLKRLPGWLGARRLQESSS